MTPRQRVLKRVLLESLRRYRQFGELSGPEFESRMADYPAYLRATADEYEFAPAELAIEEKPGLTGYSDWAETYDDEPDNPVIAGEALVFDKLLARLSVASVLDVGAGTGRHAIPLARAGHRVTAVEPNPEMLARAREKAAAEKLDIEFASGDIYRPLEDGRVFDLVLCCLVLSHVPDLGRAMDALAERVAPGGHLIVTDFHPFNMLTGMRTSYFHGAVKFNVPNTVRLASDIVEAAARRGLQLQAFHECGSIYPGLPATLVLMFGPPVPR